ncbi:Chemotaxis protein methyltransferase CheR (EC 2.1.1.80) [Azospirillum melinis]
MHPMRTFKPNLSHRFVAYLMVLSILPLLGLGFASFEIARSALQTDAGRYLTQLVRERQRLLDLQTEQIESLIANISGVEAIISALTTPYAATDNYTRLATQARIGYILNGYQNTSGLVSIDIFSADGTHYHVGDTLDVGNVRSPILTELREAAARSERPVHWAGIIDNVNGNSHKKKVISAAKAITAIDKATLQQVHIAVLIVNYDADHLYDQFNPGSDAGIRLSIVDGMGRLVYDADQRRIGTAADNALVNLLAGDGGQTIGNFNGAPHLVRFMRSQPSGWLVVGAVPLALMEAQAAGIGKATALVGLACLVVVGLAALSYSRGVVDPIRRVTAQFQRLREGRNNLRSRLPAHGDDEIAELTRGLNAFLDGLEERERAEKRQKLLIDELNHRVKNTLAIVQAMAMQTFQYSDSLDDFQKGFIERLMALSKTHNLLTRNVWQDVNLHDVVLLELAPHGGARKDRFSVDGDDVSVSPKAAVTLGLAFHELATNAAKYGALSVPSGKVAVTWERKQSADRRLCLEWREMDGPPVETPHRQGFGSLLIECGLARELDGTVHLDFRRQGVRCVMELPLDRISTS